MNTFDASAVSEAFGRVLTAAGWVAKGLHAPPPRYDPYTDCDLLFDLWSQSLRYTMLPEARSGLASMLQSSQTLAHGVMDAGSLLFLPAVYTTAADRIAVLEFLFDVIEGHYTPQDWEQ